MDATVTFKDGTTHTYKGVPDGIAPDMVEAQATKEFGKQVVSLSGGSGNYFPEGDSRNEPAAVTVGPNKAGIMDTAIDMARSVPGGLAKGAAAIAGIPGDINAVLTAAADWAMNKVDPETLAKMQAARSQPQMIPSPPTSGEALDAMTDRFGGLYKPKTTAGQYTETVASFAPNALAPGSAINRVARVVVPGMASEEAGQAVRGTKYEKYEPLARAAGALVGGVGEGIAEGIGHARANPTLSPEALGQAKDATYKAAEQANVTISPQSFQTYANDLGSEITKNNVVSAKLHPQTLAAIEAVQGEASLGKPISLERADIIRQEINGAFENASAADSRILTKVKSSFDKYIDNLTPADTLSGDASVAVPILKEARSLAQREFKSQQIQKLIDIAQNQAAGNNSALGVGQAMRQQFKNLNAQLIKDPNLAKSFSDAERAAIEQVVNGGPVENALRLFGKLAPTNNISMYAGPSLGAAAGGAIGGPVGAVLGAFGVPALGGLSRGSASLLTQRNAKLAEELMRAGQANPGATSIPRNVILSTLLSQRAH